MTAQESFRLIYASQVIQHLLAIDRKYHSMIRETIERQLIYEPDIANRNRKPLSRSTPLEATWEIRFGPDNRFRVFYRIDQSLRIVYIQAIGVKIGSKLFIDREEFDL